MKYRSRYADNCPRQRCIRKISVRRYFDRLNFNRGNLARTDVSFDLPVVNIPILLPFKRSKCLYYNHNDGRVAL